VILWVAATVFSQLQVALNAIWEVTPAKTSGTRQYIRKRLISILMVLGIGLLILASLAASTIVSSLERLLEQPVDDPGPILQLADLSITVVVLVVLLSLTYRLLPAARVAWLDVLPGAILTAVLLTIGKYFIALYLGRSNVVSAYGAASSLVVLLLWIYYSALIFFYGAAFSYVFSERRKTGADAVQNGEMPA
jgi:membrane protein